MAAGSFVAVTAAEYRFFIETHTSMRCGFTCSAAAILRSSLS
jgi:hypothetical protein